MSARCPKSWTQHLTSGPEQHLGRQHAGGHHATEGQGVAPGGSEPHPHAEAVQGAPGVGQVLQVGMAHALVGVVLLVRVGHGVWHRCHGSQVGLLLSHLHKDLVV